MHTRAPLRETETRQLRLSSSSRRRRVTVTPGEHTLPVCFRSRNDAAELSPRSWERPADLQLERGVSGMNATGAAGTPAIFGPGSKTPEMLWPFDAALSERPRRRSQATVASNPPPLPDVGRVGADGHAPEADDGLLQRGLLGLRIDGFGRNNFFISGGLVSFPAGLAAAASTRGATPWAKRRAPPGTLAAAANRGRRCGCERSCREVTNAHGDQRTGGDRLVAARSRG